jgi:hypothetical protein
LPVDMNKGARAFACGIGDFGEALLDQFPGAGAAIGEIIGQAGKCRIILHAFSLFWSLLLAAEAAHPSAGNRWHTSALASRECGYAAALAALTPDSQWRIKTATSTIA